MAEGFAVGQGGSGTYVFEGFGSSARVRVKRSADLRLSRFGLAAVDTLKAVDYPRPQQPSLRYDFSDGRSDVETFPFEAWRRILLRHARMAPVRQFDYGEAVGSLDLREAIFAHVRRSPAVLCDPSEVSVVHGSQQALDLIARVL